MSEYFQGNLTFGVDGDVTLIENKKLVSVMRELLSTKEENVEKALLYRTVATGRDVIEKQHTEQEASYGRDALAKVRDKESVAVCGRSKYDQQTQSSICD